MANKIRQTRTLAIYGIGSMKLYVTWMNGDRFKVDTMPKSEVKIMNLNTLHEYLYMNYGIVGNIFYDEANDWNYAKLLDENSKQLIKQGKFNEKRY